MESGDPPIIAPKPSGKKGKRLSQKEQSERFKATAWELEVDETGEKFRQAFEKVVRVGKADDVSGS